MLPSILAKRGTLLLFAAIIAAYFYGLGSLPFVGPDEPRYAQVAREMWQRGDWITPTLGGHLWFEKPALLYWMMIGSYKVFGVSEFAARVPSAFCGVLTIAAIFYLARRIERSADLTSTGFATNAGFVCASTLGLMIFARAASFDIVLTMTITWALVLFFFSELEERTTRRRIFLGGFFVFIGLSLLAKGFIGIVFPVGVVATYYLALMRLPDRTTLMSFGWGIPLVLIVAASWYGPVIARNGWPFIDQFILKHQLQRYVSNDYRHPGAFYYYFLILPLLALPWTVFLLEAAVRSRPRLRINPRDMSPVDRTTILAWAWILFPLLFFSFSRAKLPAYILPAIPAVALVVAIRTLRLDQSKRSPAVTFTAVLFVLDAVGAITLVWLSGDLRKDCMLVALPLIAGSIALIFSKRQYNAVTSIALTAALVSILALACASPFADRESSKRLIELANSRGYNQTLIYGLMPDDRTPEFYAAGRVIYQSTGEPEMYIGPPQLVNETLRRRQTLLAFIPSHGVRDLSSAHAATTELIGDNGRHALVAVHPKLK